MALRLILLLFLLNACNPIVGATSFMHSLVTGNTVGTISGGAGIAIEGYKIGRAHVRTPVTS